MLQGVENTRLENSGTGKVWNSHVWHNLVAHMNTENILTTVLTYVHFRRFLFQYSGRFSELYFYATLHF